MSAADKTYGFLRMAMVLVIVLLAASIAIEWAMTDPSCLQTSISAYYYTPVQAIFVGALVAIGVCLVVLRGNTPWEDIWLNLAGMLAPIVAFVPTSGAGSCRSTAVPLRDTPADIENNMGALIIVGIVALALSIRLVVRSAGVAKPTGWDARQKLGIGVGTAILVGGSLWFLLDRDSFESGAHYTAAITLFVCVVIVVHINALDFGAQAGQVGELEILRNRYGWIAAAMVVVPILMVAYRLVFGWDHMVLGIEAALILFFAIFWAIQTLELRDRGLRASSAAGAAAPSAAAVR